MQKEIKLPERYKYIAAMLTMRCNFDCSYCLNAFSKTEGEKFDRKRFNEIPGDKWVEALNRISSKEVPVTFSGGEPFVHRDFISILNNLKPELKIDILTNLNWGDNGIERFIKEVNPERLKRDSPYPSIRASYHPEQMSNGEKLLMNVKKLKDAGFNVGIYSVQYPSPAQLEAITQMQFQCRNEGIDFRVKDFTGKYESTDDLGRPFSITYGNYSKYLGAAFNNQTKRCLCRTSELLIGTDASVYKCHRDLYAAEKAIGNLLDPEFQVQEVFRECDYYGKCHPCDVKVKTNSRQELDHTSVEIDNIK